MIIVVHYKPGERQKLEGHLIKLNLKKCPFQVTSDDQLRHVIPVYGEPWHVPLLQELEEVAIVSWRKESEKEQQRPASGNSVGSEVNMDPANKIPGPEEC